MYQVLAAIIQDHTCRGGPLTIQHDHVHTVLLISDNRQGIEVVGPDA
jgi:hypothetical protein